MLTQFKMDCRLHKADFLICLLVELGGFLLGVLLVYIIMRTDNEADSWFCLGTVMALVAAVILVLFVGGFGDSLLRGGFDLFKFFLHAALLLKIKVGITKASSP